MAVEGKKGDGKSELLMFVFVVIAGLNLLITMIRPIEKPVVVKA